MSWCFQPFTLEVICGMKASLGQVVQLIQPGTLSFRSTCLVMEFRHHPVIRSILSTEQTFLKFLYLTTSEPNDRLLTEKLYVRQIALVTGWSMAGCQSFQWGAQYPDFVRAILPFCASAKTSEHNIVFLEGVKAALTADSAYNNGNYQIQPTKGLKAFGRVYAGWAYSQTFYREQMYRQLGFNSS